MSLKLRKECTLCVSKDSIARDAPAVVGSFFNLEDVRKYNRYTPSTRVKDWPNEQREWEQTLAIEFAKSSPHIEHSNVCVYHLFKDRCTHCGGSEQTLRCFDVYPYERLRSAEEEPLHDDTVRVDGNWGKAFYSAERTSLIHFRFA